MKLKRLLFERINWDQIKNFINSAYERHFEKFGNVAIKTKQFVVLYPMGGANKRYADAGTVAMIKDIAEEWLNDNLRTGYSIKNIDVSLDTSGSIPRVRIDFGKPVDESAGEMGVLSNSDLPYIYEKSDDEFGGKPTIEINDIQYDSIGQSTYSYVYDQLLSWQTRQKLKFDIEVVKDSSRSRSLILVFNDTHTATKTLDLLNKVRPSHSLGAMIAPHGNDY